MTGVQSVSFHGAMDRQSERMAVTRLGAAVRSGAPAAPTAMRVDCKTAGMEVPLSALKMHTCKPAIGISQSNIQLEGRTSSKPEVLPTGGKRWSGN